jgi:hypothetical protein
VIFAELNEQNDPARSGRLAMSVKCSLIAATVVILLAGSGCETCGSKGFGVAYEAGPNCEVPTCQRNQVYVFAVCGVNPLESLALDHLREELNKQGFSKVASGHTVFAYSMASQMRQIHAENPDAAFIIIGSETGAPTAVRFAEKAVADGLPVAAFVLLDRDGHTALPNLGVRTIAIGGPGAATSATGEAVVVAGTGRFTLASDMRTADVITRLLNEIAWTIPQTVQVENEWSYPHTPPARPMLDPGPHVDWAFLFDEPGGVTRAINESAPVVTSTTAKPATPAPIPAYTSAAQR